MDQYTIGIDFGTLSARAVLVRVSDGSILASAQSDYHHGVMDSGLPDGTQLPLGWALQDPRDYIAALEDAVHRLLDGVDADEIVGIGVDFTSSTTLPVDHQGTPLCCLPEFSDYPHAYAKLWKHHGAQDQADRMTRVAQERGESWLNAYGGKVSSEWSLPKLLQVLEEAPEIYKAIDSWIEAGDWIVEYLCGKRIRSRCAAGYKSFFTEEYPSEAYFEALNPEFTHVISEKCSGQVIPVFEKAGELTPEMAKRLGLRPGTAVAVSMVDAHACVPAAGLNRPGQMLAIIGTSTCFMTLSEELRTVPGISGSIRDGILPGWWGYEAGQSCVGDLFAWAAELLAPDRDDAHAYLTALSQNQKPGQHGLIALDWWNGSRSILMDSELMGLMVGMTLKTRPEDIYRALIEATAYGARLIVENYREHGIPVDEFFVTGGICQKNEMLLQIYADVLGMPVRVVSTSQGGALGSAIVASVAAGVYQSPSEAIRAMASPVDLVWTPDAENHRIYTELYQIYCQLHDQFGREKDSPLKRLEAIKRK